MKALIELLSKYAIAVGLEEIGAHIEQNAEPILNKSGELSTCMTLLFDSLMKTFSLTEKHLFFGILKAVNQDALSAGVLHLRKG